MSSDASSSLLSGKKKGYRDHYVNSTAFTVGMSLAAVVIIGSVLMGGSMLVASSAKEAQELLPADPPSLQNKAYGATHAGVGFANYVVGNEVSKFWSSEMGKKDTHAKISDPFASFLLKPKKGKKARGSRGRSAEAPEQQADDAQPVDRANHKIGGARATDAAIQHAQDVAMTHVKSARSSRVRHSGKQ